MAAALSGDNENPAARAPFISAGQRDCHRIVMTVVAGGATCLIRMPDRVDIELQAIDEP
ncbi:hypothetical protein [Kaistia terrae]|uniref:Uncharacterized protein n=1 Tax=Kaistia terrae TaxID=537017 RepID=A0ABW0PTL2_9HYPH|nr:hypothetical protein [Kaistia terrae]MCX5577046.1 hypothetical protein [Kaistia terrae]